MSMSRLFRLFPESHLIPVFYRHFFFFRQRKNQNKRQILQIETVITVFLSKQIIKMIVELYAQVT